MADQTTMLDDIPFEARAALYTMTCAETARVPLRTMLRRNYLDGHGEAIYKQVKGINNLSAGTLVLLCKLYDDFTPIAILFADHGLSITIDTHRKHTGDMTIEALEAAGALGEMSTTLVTALKSKTLTREQRAQVARNAEATIRELRDVISCSTKEQKP